MPQKSTYLENYYKLFDIYLKILKEDFNPNSYYDNDLEKLCHDSERFKEKLLGMVTLLELTKDMTNTQADSESNRIIKTFNAGELFSCYLDKEYGVMVFRDRAETVDNRLIQGKNKRTELER